ncbi:MAG: hypothetical protein AB7I59_13595 [Geminicoccaceae bacterium]
MPITPSPAQSEASRLNGALSAGPTSEAGKARSALNSVRHGLTGRSFFLLPDEDPEEFKAHEASWLDQWRPRDAAERDLAELAIRALWREIRADRLEARILADLFSAAALAEEPARRAAQALAMRSLATLLRYRTQIAKEHDAAMRSLNSLRRRKLDPPLSALRDEPEPANDTDVRDEPERALNRHQRRALEAIRRKRVA